MSNPDITLCLLLHQAFAKLRLQLDEELGTYHGIDFEEFALLQALASTEDKSASLAILAAGLGTSRSAMLRRLRPLEKIGLVASHGGVSERRVALRPAALGVIRTAGDTVARICAKRSFSKDFSVLAVALRASEMAHHR